MRKVWKKCVAVAAGAMLLAATWLGPGAASVSANTQLAQQHTYRIIALGDSLTVGYEPGMQPGSRPYGFVERVHEQALYHGRTEVVNLGIGGLKTGGLRNYVRAISEGRTIRAEEIQPGLAQIDPRAQQIGAGAAQLKPVLVQADLITVTIGGNDLIELVHTASDLSEAELTARLQEMFRLYRENVTAVLTQLHALNPDALIVLADQYNPVPKIAGEATYVQLVEATREFTRMIDEMAAEFGERGVKIKVAHVAQEFVGSELTMTHILKEDIHPNQYGYETIAKAFARTIWGSYKLSPVPESGQPMRIVVKGEDLITPYQPIMRSNRNYVAIQDIVNAIGAATKWDNKTSSATITYGDQTVVVKIGANTIKVNGADVPIEAPAFLHKVGKEDKTYVPLAAIATGLGLDVQYVAKLRTAFINL
ncbi:GDSL-type esterase/lipase family protein [Paenibacillus sp. FSL M8-0334]|uniref:Copper amine oxidase n=1 Tax=Paenibacillus campinasensis TaxID=66347 RepID=A0ABW9T5Y6_9BACL|nr:GDSL-type esterase/lipase family protein [Paenibacillus campinasensis]MUG68143.1 copper amine oxidase [Paenibacillus campinasensis]